MQMTIFCLINEFEFKHPIYLMNLETNSSEYLGEVAADDIGHTIAKHSYERNIPDVVIGGSSRSYLERFVDDVYTVNALMYNNNNEIRVSIVDYEEE